MGKNILNFVSELVGWRVGELTKTDQQTNLPTDQLCYPFCFFIFDILFPNNIQVYGLNVNLSTIEQTQYSIK
jgi:hypothetical protein